MIDYNEEIISSIQQKLLGKVYYLQTICDTWLIDTIILLPHTRKPSCTLLYS